MDVEWEHVWESESHLRQKGAWTLLTYSAQLLKQ